MTKKQYFLFNSTQEAIKSEKICREANIPVTVVPVPRELSSECGIAMESDAEVLSAVREALNRNGIPFKHGEL